MGTTMGERSICAGSGPEARWIKNKVGVGEARMCDDDVYDCCMSPYAFTNFYTKNKSNKKNKN